MSSVNTALVGYRQSRYINRGQIKIASRKVAKALRCLYISSRLGLRISLFCRIVDTLRQ